MARYKRAARDLGAFICFEDEAGQGLRPPKGRTWAPRGARPVVKVRGAGGGRVSIAGVACYRPGDRPHLFYHLLVYRRRKGEPKGFTWADYRDLIIAAHRQLSAPLVWCRDNLNIHLAPELAEFAAENKEWLRIYRLPAYAPDLNPNTRDLRNAGLHEAVIWDFALVWTREGLPVKVWVSKSTPFQEPLCFLICLTLLMQAGSLPARMRARLPGRWWCGRLACGFAGRRSWRE